MLDDTDPPSVLAALRPQWWRHRLVGTLRFRDGDARRINRPCALEVTTPLPNISRTATTNQGLQISPARACTPDRRATGFRTQGRKPSAVASPLAPTLPRGWRAQELSASCGVALSTHRRILATRWPERSNLPIEAARRALLSLTPFPLRARHVDDPNRADDPRTSSTSGSRADSRITPTAST